MSDTVSTPNTPSVKTDNGTPVNRIVHLFINRLDSGLGLQIGRHLSSLIPAKSSLHNEELSFSNASYSGSFSEIRREYEISGIMSKYPYKKAPYLMDYVMYSDEKAIKAAISRADVIIYNCARDLSIIPETEWALDVLLKSINDFTEPKIFILLATVMSWAMTEKHSSSELHNFGNGQLDPIPISEHDWRRRKPHPNYLALYQLEEQVIKAGEKNPELLSTYIVSTGICYAGETGFFQYFLKTAWNGVKPVPLIGNGKNVMPIISIKDYVQIIQLIIERAPTNVKFILATDGTSWNLEEVINAIASKMSSFPVQRLEMEEGYLIKELKTLEIDVLTCNILMKSYVIQSVFNYNFLFEKGIIPNIDKLIDDFLSSHKLQHLRIFLHIPPGLPKKELLTLVSGYYQLNCIQVRDVITEVIAAMEEIVGASTQDKSKDQSSFAHSNDSEKSDVEEMLRTIYESMENNNGIPEDQYIVKMIKEKLLSKRSFYQGYVLEGFPLNLKQAKELFGVSEEEINEDGITRWPLLNKNILPDFVITISAPIEKLKENLTLIPQSQVLELYGNEEEMFHQLAEYIISSSSTESSLISYFTDNKVKVRKIVDIQGSLTASGLFERIQRIIGRPKKSGQPVFYQEEELLKASLDRDLEIDIQYRKQKDKERQLRQKQTEELYGMLRIKEEEEQILSEISKPLMKYLSDKILPYLLQAIIDCYAVEPEDPVDYLANYLFKFTPTNVVFEKNKQ